MNIVELYKEHINLNPSGSEINELFQRFLLNGAVVFNPLDDALQ